MFILKNAWISITRNKGRNILIGIIILVIACASTTTLAISNTATDLINSYQSAYDKELTISFNRENMKKDFDFSKRDSLEDAKEKFDNISSYTIADVENFAKSDHIESYYYTYDISLNGNNIEKAESQTSSAMSGMPGMPQGDNMPGMGGFSNSSSYDFTLNGYSSLAAMSEFIEGTYTVTELTDDAWDKAFTGNYVFINEELASYNNLSLNDEIQLKDDAGNVYTFTIIGIYKENESGNAGPVDLFSNSVNTLITNANALVVITNTNSDIRGTVEPTFIIDDYNNADTIKNEFYGKGLNENYTVETNEEVATAGLSSIKNVQSFATTFLIITLLIGGIVLLVINMINIRERKYEIGVLRTIGISKPKLTLQFVSELLIVGLIALMLGAGIGAVSSKGISNALLASEIKSSESSAEKMKNNFGGGGPGGFNPMSGVPGGAMSDNPMDGGTMGSFGKKGVPDVQAYESIDAVVNLGVLLELLGIGLTLILISSIAAMVSIQRFSPLTILKERS
ncbi:ABC transporter permease [Candidatus Saccharibacteria bacterium]|nr:ABC transporter permease [Candidatus Saccharibacteria bacterium]